MQQDLFLTKEELLAAVLDMNSINEFISDYSVHTAPAEWRLMARGHINVVEKNSGHIIKRFVKIEKGFVAWEMYSPEVHGKAEFKENEFYTPKGLTKLEVYDYITKKCGKGNKAHYFADNSCWVIASNRSSNLPFWFFVKCYNYWYPLVEYHDCPYCGKVHKYQCNSEDSVYTPFRFLPDNSRWTVLEMLYLEGKR